MNSMVEDFDTFHRFVSWLPDTERDEVYFLSLSARNKYLTSEEREQYGLGRTEMFSRETAYDKQGLPYVMQKLHASLSYRRTRGGVEIPRHALVVYMNVNPSSTIAAYEHFTRQMDTVLHQTCRASLASAQVPFDPWRHLQRHLMNAIQKSPSRRVLVDIDIDTHDPDIHAELVDFLDEHSVEYATLTTRGGYHVVLRKETMGKFNLHAKLVELQTRSGAEVCINRNAMVPVPGTRQGGVLVQFDVG